MPKLSLAIETSTRVGGVAVVDRETGRVVFEEAFLADRSHNSMVFAPLRRALEAGGREASEIVVGTGPGSYTGTRIGIAAAQGVALSLGIPVRGVCSLLAADPPPGDRFLVVGDARRGAFFTVELAAGGVVAGPKVASRDEALGAIARFREAGVPVVTFDEEPPFEAAEPRVPRASRLARVEPPAAPPRGGVVEPVYLRAPFVTVPRPRGLASPGRR